MKIVLALPLIAAVAAGCALEAPVETADPAASLAAAETAFAAQSVREDMRAAFMANFADDGVFVRDGWTVGNAWLAGRPAPPIVLDWRPVYTEVARSGELGLSTGPWKITSKANPAEPPAYGQFVSVWRRDGSRRWLVAVDLGIAHPQSALWDASLDARGAREAGPPPRETLAAAEARFEEAARASGMLRALTDHAADDVRLYRPGSAPLIGKAQALSRAALAEERHGWTMQRSETARSGDFGYARGHYGDASKPAGYFLRVWRAEQGRWRVILDVINPAPA